MSYTNPHTICAYVGREGSCGRNCYGGRCFQHRVKLGLTPCVQCGRGTGSATGFCRKNCANKQVYNSNKMLRQRQVMAAYIDDVLSWDWTQPQCQAPATPPPAPANRPPPAPPPAPHPEPHLALLQFNKLVRNAVEAHLGYGPISTGLSREQKHLFSGVFAHAMDMVQTRMQRYGESIPEALANINYEEAVRRCRR